MSKIARLLPVIGKNKKPPWYLSGGVAAVNCLAAYKAIGAADIATSYINLANPGTYNLTGGTAPTFDTAVGWTFNGSNQYKSTGIDPAANATQTWSIIARFSGCTAAGGFMIGGAAYFGMTVRTTPVRRVYNPNVVSDTGAFVDNGVICVAGLNGYWNGVVMAGGPFAWADIDIGTIQIGQINNLYWAGNVLAVAIYDTVLTAPQVLAISNAMAALPFDVTVPAFPSPTPAGTGEFTIAFFTDSHVGSAVTEGEINTMTGYLRDHATQLNLQAVLFGGDYADDVAHSDERAAFVAAMGNISNIPHLLAMGNHDYDYAGGYRNSTVFNSVFGQSYYTGKGWWSGDFCEAGRSENAYFLLTIGAVDYIFITLELFPREAVIDWADALLTTYAARKAIIVTHAYEYTDNTPYSVGDPFGPDGEQEAICDADYHWGDDVWTELLNVHDNVILIHSGHIGGFGKHVANSAGGQPVNQIIANYQSAGDWTDTAIRFMRFNPTAETISVESFSPVALQKRTDADNQFTLSY